MPTHGAQQRASETPCDFTDVVSRQAPTRWAWSRSYRDDIDEVVVTRLVAGDRIRGTRYERLEAVRRLHRAQLSINEIADRLGIHYKQADRDLIDLGIRTIGANARRRARAAARRRAVVALVEAGARRREIEVLLHVSEKVITTDLQLLGIGGTGANRRPIRSRDELLATFGHLLDTTDEVRAGVA